MSCRTYMCRVARQTNDRGIYHMYNLAFGAMPEAGVVGTKVSVSRHEIFRYLATKSALHGGGKHEKETCAYLRVYIKNSINTASETARRLSTLDVYR